MSPVSCQPSARGKRVYPTPLFCTWLGEIPPTPKNLTRPSEPSSPDLSQISVRFSPRTRPDSAGITWLGTPARRTGPAHHSSDHPVPQQPGTDEVGAVSKPVYSS